MIIDQRREVLERLAQGELTPDEAEHHLAALDATEPETQRLDVGSGDTRPLPTEVPAGTGESSDALTHKGFAEEHADDDAAGAEGAASAGAAMVKARLSSSGLIEVAGDDDAREARIEGPHNCSVKQSSERTKVSGDVGDDALLVIPSDAHLDLEANSPNALVRGLRGTLRATFNVGKARVEGILTRGNSEIEANVGLLDVVFHTGSDVRVAVRCAARIEPGNGLRKVGRGEWAVGTGAGHLDITGSPGTISLSVE